MTSARRCARRTLIVAVALAGALVGSAPAAAQAPEAGGLAWSECASAAGWQCATAAVPRDYAQPGGPTVDLAVTRLPAKDPQRRIGSLFVNFGGPGGPVVDTLHAAGEALLASVNDRFDIVGFDPRGVGRSRPAVDCNVDQETEGAFSQPFDTPETVDPAKLIADDQRYIRRCMDLNPGILPHLATGNVARDMDVLRAAVGDEKLTYLGFSYGTYLGAVYASMFPDRHRALVLDGAVDPELWADRPLEVGSTQAAAFERALGRFFQACAADKVTCPFGGADPHAAYDALLERLAAAPLPATGPHPEPVDDDDLRLATIQPLYAKQLWPLLAATLAEAEAGDGTLIRLLVDVIYGRLDDGSYDPFYDQFFSIVAADGRWPRKVEPYLKAGERAWRLFDHFYFNSGYAELAWGLYPVEARGAYRGPFRVPAPAPAPLVIGTTYDPATPYRAATSLVRQLGNARLLTMHGDGHTAYGGNSACIDTAVDAYLEEGTLPAPGAACSQEVPFAPPQAVPTSAGAAKRMLRRLAPQAVAQPAGDVR